MGDAELEETSGTEEESANSDDKAEEGDIEGATESDADAAGPEPPEAPEVEAVEGPKPVLQENPPNFFSATADGRDVGRLHKIGNSWKATCMRHGGKCGCWVTLKGKPSIEEMATLRQHLFEWLEQFGVSKEDHSRMARDIKILHGMKPRK